MLSRILFRSSVLFGNGDSKKRKNFKKSFETCAYTGEKMKFKTVEHILPKSKGGANAVANWLPADAKINQERGNIDFKSWFKIHPEIKKNIQNVIDSMRGKKVCNIDWSTEVVKTLNNQLGKIVFRGRLKSLKWQPVVYKKPKSKDIR